jgi:hypothetical protein
LKANAVVIGKQQSRHTLSFPMKNREMPLLPGLDSKDDLSNTNLTVANTSKSFILLLRSKANGRATLTKMSRNLLS